MFNRTVFGINWIRDLGVKKKASESEYCQEEERGVNNIQYAGNETNRNSIKIRSLSRNKQ